MNPLPLNGHVAATRAALRGDLGRGDPQPRQGNEELIDAALTDRADRSNGWWIISLPAGLVVPLDFLLNPCSGY